MTKNNKQKKIPEGWRVERLGNVVDITTGNRDANHGSVNGEYFFFTCAKQILRIEEYAFDTEAVLIAGNGDFNVKYYKGKFDVYQRTYVLSNFNKTIGSFIYYKSQQALRDIVKNNQGSSVKFIKKGDLTEYKFLLPPLQEQKKIAEILGAVDEDIERTEEVIEKTERLKKGLMQELFICGIGHTKFKKTKLGKIPESWKVVKLENIASIERGKFSHRPRNAPEFYGGQYPFIQTGDVVESGGKIVKYTQTLNEKGLEISRLFKKGTIVITIAANIGDTGILQFDSCFPDSLVGIVVNKKVINNIFLEYFLRTKKKYLNSIATQSAQKNINLQKLKPMLIVQPKLQEQQKIAEILSAVDEKISANKKLKEKLTRLKKGLMQDFLSGEVRVKV